MENKRYLALLLTVALVFITSCFRFSARVDNQSSYKVYNITIGEEIYQSLAPEGVSGVIVKPVFGGVMSTFNVMVIHSPLFPA